MIEFQEKAMNELREKHRKLQIEHATLRTDLYRERQRNQELITEVAALRAELEIQRKRNLWGKIGKRD